MSGHFTAFGVVSLKSTEYHYTVFEYFVAVANFETFFKNSTNYQHTAYFNSILYQNWYCFLAHNLHFFCKKIKIL